MKTSGKKNNQKPEMLQKYYFKKYFLIKTCKL